MNTSRTERSEKSGECSTESIKLSRLVVPVLLAVRAELDLPIDNTTYTKIIEEGLKKQEAYLQEFLQDAPSLLTTEEQT
jgi:hypothetical protein